MNIFTKLFLLIFFVIFVQDAFAYKYTYTNNTDKTIIIRQVVGTNEPAEEKVVEPKETTEFNYPPGTWKAGLCACFSNSCFLGQPSKYKIKDESGSWTDFINITNKNTNLSGLNCGDRKFEITKNPAGDIRFTF